MLLTAFGSSIAMMMRVFLYKAPEHATRMRDWEVFINDKIAEVVRAYISHFGLEPNKKWAAWMKC